MSSERKPVVLAVDDVADHLATVRELLETENYEVLTAANRDEALSTLDTNFVDLLLLDQRIGRTTGTKLLQDCRGLYPGLAGIIFTGYADLIVALEAMRAGAADLLEKPLRKEALFDCVARALADSRLVREMRHHRWRAAHDFEFSSLVGESDSMLQVKARIRQVAATTAPVLIQGENGTGKDLVARAIHSASPRRGRPFIAVNAGAIPAGLMESTFFGSRKGSYTDSRVDQVGYFEAAKGGTLLLDEIGETTPEVQVRLLRVLQEKTVTRVGDVTPIQVDARIIAASNRDLLGEVEARRFRQDLYFRLAVFPITLPPLRERLSDIEAIARHALARHTQEQARPIKDFARGCFDKLREYRWPGNVRELDNVIQRAVILATGSVITADNLVVDAVSSTESSLESLLDDKFREAETRFERLYFRRLLARAGDKKTKAAELAGLDRSVLYAHLRQLGEGGSKE